MTIQEANKRFDALSQFPPDTQQVLIAEGRAFLTHKYRDDGNLYSGSLVTYFGNDFDEAERIAEARNQGETVEGCIVDIIRCDVPATTEINLN